MEPSVLCEIHAGLIAEQPSDAQHDVADCPFCNPVLGDEHLQGGEMTKQYSQEELEAAVAEAVKPIQAAFDDLKASQVESEVDARIASVKAELDTRISELQAELDSAVLKAAEAEKTHADYVAALEAMEAEQAHKAELAARKDQRLSLVREVASFPDDYIEANAERWAAIDDTEFEALVNDWKAISAAKKETTDSGIPKVTAMVASRTDDGSKSVLREVLEWNLSGVDVTRL